MTNNTLKCYGIKMSTAEVIFHVSTGAMTEFLESLDVVGVYQDQKGEEQLIAFYSKQAAKSALKRAKEMGFNSVELYPTMIYISEDDIKNKNREDTKET